jgi:16S rRNA (adenine1518-N6/adenine1519-N6)-dimethyltransferase
MEKVKAKKHLGQHFLKDLEIAKNIAHLVPPYLDSVIEIGPGMGVLTTFLYLNFGNRLTCVEIDKESVDFLNKEPWARGLQLLQADFLKQDFSGILNQGKVGIIGNYPYNISTEIVFKVIEHCDLVHWFGGMFQKEVAERFCAKHGSKTYGVTSVLLQSLYDCFYDFTVSETAFVPPPKVKSGVMHCIRKTELLPCKYKSLSLVVKTAFSQRRKTLNNTLKPLTASSSAFVIPEPWKGLRAEQLSVADFIHLAKLWENRI